MSERPIVVCVDGTTTALRAVAWAAQEAQLQDRPLRLVHAAPYLGTSEDPTRGRVEAVLAQARSVAHQIAPAVSTDVAVLADPPVSALVDASADAALLVIGMIAGSGAEIVLGSVTLDVTTAARCPVTVVRGACSAEHAHSAPVLLGVESVDADAAAVSAAFDDAARHHTGGPAPGTRRRRIARRHRTVGTSRPATAYPHLSKERAMIQTQQLAEAIEHAMRAPSVHNTQPWRWRIDSAGCAVELYADLNRHLSATDPERRDLLISCGAALHHLVVALAHAGLRATVIRLPDPENRAHLATVMVSGPEVSATGAPARDAVADLFPAIGRRHTDRRRFSHRPVPIGLISGLVDAAAHSDVLLVPVERPHERFTIVLTDAADRQRWTPGYPAELQIWTRRHGGARDGIPATAIAHPPSGLAGPSGLRRFPHGELTQPLPPAGHGLPDDAAAFLLLATVDDAPADRLRTGEALSSVLLAATRAGLATTPLSQATEVAATRDTLRLLVGIPEHPQLVLRVGWPATHAAELAATPRRDLASVLVRTPMKPARS